MASVGTPGRKADLQPGDLVFFYKPISHVGIYIGNGKIVHASRTGQPVKISDMAGCGSPQRVASDHLARRAGGHAARWCTPRASREGPMNGRPVVVVTGASAGVGRAVARMYGERGAAVALLARGTTGLAGAAEDVRAAGGVALELPTDVADHEQVYAAAERAEAELGPIDVWVNVAFSAVFAPSNEIDAEEFRRATEVTYLGFVYGTKAALDRMLPRDRGAIVQVGSALAYRGIPLQSAYCGAKHAIQGFHESLRTELLHDKQQRAHDDGADAGGEHPAVRLGAVPAAERTPQPVPPIYQPEVAARAVVYAADHPAPRVLGRGPTVGDADRRTSSRRGLLDRYLGPDRVSSRSRPTSRSTPTRRRTSGSPRTARTAATTAPTAGSTTGRSPAAPSSGPPATTACSARRRGSGLAAGVAALAAGGAALLPPPLTPRVATFAAASRHVLRASPDVRGSTTAEIVHSRRPTVPTRGSIAVQQVERGGESAAAHAAAATLPPSAARAARPPQIPCTPPPGCADEPPR